MSDNLHYPKGSEWRKWDLQVHTPFSCLCNQFTGDFDEYFKRLFELAIEMQVSVIGITDYFTIEGYKKIKEYLNNDQKLGTLFSTEAIQKIKRIRLFPNIEFRLFKLVGQSRINFHVIFSDEISESDIEEHFLHDITFVNQGIPFNPDQGSKLKINCLKELGRMLKSQHEPFADKDDLFIGMMNAVVDDGEISKILNTDRFDGRYLIGIPADEDLSELDWNSQDHHVRKVLIQKSNVIFTSNEKTVLWALGKRHVSEQKYISEFKSLKPCLSSSDAHSYNNLFNKYTWIKSDPTFEGLKQIIYEPQARVYIGDEPPGKVDKSKIVRSLTISSSNGWFQEEPIEFNEDFVSVIGGKGAGKTALLDLIAYAAGSKVGEERAFLRKAWTVLEGATLHLEWCDGHPNTKVIGDNTTNHNGGDVRYLSQSFVEELCATENTAQLLNQIETVVFQKIPPEDKVQFHDFRSYRNAHTKVLADKRKRISNEISRLNNEICQCRAAIEIEPLVIDRISETRNELEGFKKQLKDMSMKVGDQINLIQKLQTLDSQKTRIEKIISQYQSMKLKCDEVLNKLSDFEQDLSNELEEIKQLLKESGIAPGIIESVHVKILPDDLGQKVSEQQNQYTKRVIRAKSILMDILSQVDSVDKQLNLEKSKNEKLKVITGQISSHKKLIEALQRTFEENLEMKGRISSLISDRKSKYMSFFATIFEEKNVLNDLYSSLRESLEANQTEKRLFQCDVKFFFQISKMAERGDQLIDHATTGRFFRKYAKALEDALREHQFDLDLEKGNLSNEDMMAIRTFVEKVEQLFSSDESGNDVNLKAQLKQDSTEFDFFEWLFSVDYFKVNYTIKFNNISLEYLSPGQRGIALLILYLDLDQEDTRPILIDQPEENLDNRSVYEMLKDYFREAKKRRQVFVITHNPNLVVNTDSEQIIVANFDKTHQSQPTSIYYKQGSLENNTCDSTAQIEFEKKSLREHVCEILEGGKEAFLKREQKYDL